MEDCINDCWECSKVCEETLVHCLKIGREHSGQKHISLVSNCADVCNLSAILMIHDSPFHMEQCEVCAQICDACADSCEIFEDEEMKACIKACRRCAESCRNMIQ